MWKTRVTQLSVQKNLSSLSCQLAAEEAYTTVSCNDSVVLSNRLCRWARKSENKRTCFDAGWPWGKRKSRLLWLDGIQFRSPNVFCAVVQCWQLNAKAKLRQVRSVTNSKTNVKEHVPVEDSSHTKLRREDLARSILPWRRAPDQRQRSAGRYIYIYIYRDRKPSQHITVGLAWGSPQLYQEYIRTRVCNTTHWGLARRNFK